MEDFDILAEGWNKISKDAAINNRNIFSNNKTTVMESILKYERQEIEGKKKQIFLMFFSLTIFVIAFGIWIYLGQLNVNNKNLVGALLLLIAFTTSLITNRTDDFPDARSLETKKYLLDLKENISYRKKRHIRFSYLSLAIVIPGLYLLLHNVPNLIGEFFPYTNLVVLVSAIAGFVGGMIAWHKQYESTTQPLLSEIDALVTEIKKEQ